MASCAAAGGSGVIATTGTTDLFAAKPVRAAAGAHFVLTVAAGAAPDECVDGLRAAGIRLIAIRPDGDPPADVNLTAPVAIIVGDDDAVPEALQRAADAYVGVPAGRGGVRAPIAAQAAVVLFEAARRQSGRSANV